VTTGSANEAVWAACVPSNSVTALGSAYILGAIDGSGGETEYKLTSDSPGTAETASFTSSSSYNAVGVTIKPFTTGAISPSISSLNPSSGNVGTSVTISGTNFGTAQGTSTVLLSGVVAAPTSWGSSSITFPVPSGATSGNVVVIVGGLASNAVSFTVAPTITG
jgi:IPT/TIG domain